MIGSDVLRPDIAIVFARLSSGISEKEKAVLLIFHPYLNANVVTC